MATNRRFPVHQLEQNYDNILDEFGQALLSLPDTF
jgi:hypothetical protein